MRRFLLTGIWNWVLLICCFYPVETFAAERLRCEVCRKNIRGQYIQSGDGRNFCSRKCFDSTLPKCENCRRICRKSAIKAKEKIFCSRKCAEEKLLARCRNCRNVFRQGKVIFSAYGDSVYCMKCMNKKKCLICERPESSLHIQHNGNALCQDCNHNIVSGQRQLERLFARVQNQLCRKLGFRNDHAIKLQMQNIKLSEADGAAGTREFGMYNYSGKIIESKPLPFEFWREQKTSVRYENESCSITIMEYLPEIKAAEVIAHELAHDYMLHRWRYIHDRKLQEGFAELVAALYNQMSGNAKWNYRMEKNPDKIYGDGYRHLKRIFDQGNWPGVCRYLDGINQREATARQQTP